MSAKSGYEAGYTKYYGSRFDNISYSTSEEEIEHLYRDWASTYDKDLQSAGYVLYQALCQYLNESIKQECQDKSKNEMKIIDVGAGTGLLGVQLHELGYTSLTAIDISAEMLNEARKKNVYKKFICAFLSDQRIPEIGTGEYDALICAGTLVKGHARSSAFVEMIRIVRIGGLLCFSIRDDHLGAYQEKMMELEKDRRWEKVSTKKIPLYDCDDMPKDILGFVYRVLKN